MKDNSESVAGKIQGDNVTLGGSQPPHSQPCECPEGRDDLYHCISCDACCFGWGTYGSKYDDYLSRGKCAECAMKEDGMTLEEMQYLVEQ